MGDHWGEVIQGVSTILGAVILYVIRRLYHSVNSKMDRLLDLTAKSAKAEGVLQEKTRHEDAEKKAFRGGD